MIVRKPKSEKSVWFTSQVEKENSIVMPSYFVREHKMSGGTKIRAVSKIL